MPELGVLKAAGSSKSSTENVTFYWKAKRGTPEATLYEKVRGKGYDINASFMNFLKVLDAQPLPKA